MFKKVFVSTMLVGCALGCERTAPDANVPIAQTPSAEQAAHAERFIFSDITASSGVDFTTTSGRMPSSQILEVKGGGLALIDYDNDGDLDLFVPNGATLDAPDDGPGCRMFENVTEQPGAEITFRDATDDLGLTFNRWGLGVAVGDYDEDGFSDIYITCYGPNVLLRNVNGERFDDVTQQTDTSGAVSDDRNWSTAAAFGDIDGDGDLDLYVSNYLKFDTNNPPPPSSFRGNRVFAGPSGLPAQADVLLLNELQETGAATFRDITKESGVDQVAPSYGLGVVILDFNADGKQDIYVGNDSMANFMFINQGLDEHGVPQFEDTALYSGAAANFSGGEQATMGVAIGDVNADGTPDIFTTNFASDTNTLHVNENGKFFNDETRRYGLGMTSNPYLGWASEFYDFDHDGDEDLLIVNGHVYPGASAATMSSDYEQPPLLYERDGNRFERVDVEAPDGNLMRPWLAAKHVDRSAVFGDLVLDGDIDVVISELNGPLRVLRNDNEGGNWLSIGLSPRNSAKTLGARVEVTADETTQTRWLYSGGGFLSVSTPHAHFGLHKDVKFVDVKITLPNGSTRTLERVETNQHVQVEFSQ